MDRPHVYNSALMLDTCLLIRAVGGHDRGKNWLAARTAVGQLWSVLFVFFGVFCFFVFVFVFVDHQVLFMNMLT